MKCLLNVIVGNSRAVLLLLLFSGISVKLSYSFYYLSQYDSHIIKGRGRRLSGEPGPSLADAASHLSGLVSMISVP